MTDFLNDPTRPNSSTVPKAYLNWVVLDETQFKLVAGNYGAVQIPEMSYTDEAKILQANAGNDITIAKNVYLYVYVSNESMGSVYFDKIRVEHTAGEMGEETHYYPFGLGMAGISSKAAGSLTNKYLHSGKEKQDKEFADGCGLEFYDYGERFYVAQIGRWGVVDPKASKFPWQSPYCAMDNNPINKTDPTGMEASPIYDTDSNFLGTDDEGLKGKAIVMKKEDFTQGMKHDDALKKDLASKGGDDFLKAIPDKKKYRIFLTIILTYLKDLTMMALLRVKRALIGQSHIRMLLKIPQLTTFYT